MKKITKFFIVVDILIAICFFVVYGPFESFRNTIISTSLNTKTHQYIAYTFYSKSTIQGVSKLDSYTPWDENTKLEDIVIDTAPKSSYENEYDKEILTRDEGNEDYKLIETEVDGFKAYLVAIYNPAKVGVATSKAFNKNGTGAERMYKMCDRLGGIVCINGGGFKDPDGWGSDVPMGYIIKNGQVVWSDSSKQNDIIGISNNNKLMLVHATGEEAIEMGMRDGLQFGPFLIVNGELIKFNNAAGGYNKAARTAIAQRKDGVILFLVTEGVHANGPRLLAVAEFLQKYGAYNAANLDGGSSAQLVINGKLINRPLNVAGKEIKHGRSVVSGFILMP
jgi:exopolysaccharide biosynthesis protein